MKKLITTITAMTILSTSVQAQSTFKVGHTEKGRHSGIELGAEKKFNMNEDYFTLIGINYTNSNSLIKSELGFGYITDNSFQECGSIYSGVGKRLGDVNLSVYGTLGVCKGLNLVDLHERKINEITTSPISHKETSKIETGLGVKMEVELFDGNINPYVDFSTINSGSDFNFNNKLSLGVSFSF